LPESNADLQPGENSREPQEPDHSDDTQILEQPEQRRVRAARSATTNHYQVPRYRGKEIREEIGEQVLFRHERRIEYHRSKLNIQVTGAEVDEKVEKKDRVGHLIDDEDSNVVLNQVSKLERKHNA